MIMIARKSSLWRLLAVAATLAIGFGTLWFVLVALLGTWIQEAWQGGNLPPYESLVVRSDGTILIQSFPRDSLSEATYRDLSGQVQEAPDRDNLIPGVGLSGEPESPGFLSSPLGWDQRLMVFLDERQPTVNWFFVRDDQLEGAGYFVAYERTSNRRIGFVGMSGSHTGPVPRADWIPVRGEPRSSVPVSIRSTGQFTVRLERWDVPPRFVFVPFGNLLRKVDLDARTITTILDTQEPIVAPGVPAVARWSNGRPTKEQSILVRTTWHIHELDQQDRVIKVYTIPTEIDPRSSVEWYEMSNGLVIAVVEPPLPIRQTDKVFNRLVYRIAGDGTIQDRFEVGLQTGSTALSKQAQAIGVALAVPAPAVLFVVKVLEAIWADDRQSFPAAFSSMLKDSGPSMIAVAALSLILAGIVWRRCRAFGLSRPEQIAWALFVLLFGVPAYVGFRVYRPWPIRQLCPSCQAQVPRDRVACAECGAVFPEPAVKGIEIFA